VSERTDQRNYRTATPNDADAIVLLTDQAQAKRKGETIPSDVQDVREVDICREVLSDSATWSKLVYEGDYLAGCVVVTPGEYRKPETIQRGKMLIDSLMVHPDHWGRGIAGALLDDIADELGRAEVQKIGLWTEADNARSRPLYERKGYHLTGREMDHPRSGEHQVEYEKDLIAQSAAAPTSV